MGLDEWVSNGWLRRHEPSAQETAELLAVADRDLRDCALVGLSADRQLSIAYNAALQLATVALAATGYRPGRGESQHFRVIQSLEFTIGADSDLVAQFDAFRKKRNQLSYQRAGVASEQEAAEMVELANELHTRVAAFVARDHPELL